ncbi:MAG: TIM barrel protein [Promethearchaeota archaeon]
MKVGLTIQAIGGISIQKYVQIGNILGFEHYEFDPSVFDSEEDLVALSVLVSNKSVFLHAPYFNDWLYDFSSRNQVSKIETYLSFLSRFSQMINIRGIVVHPPADPKGDPIYFIEILQQIPIPIYLENIPEQSWEDFNFWYFQTKEKVKEKSSQTINICYDIPHSLIQNGPQGFLNVPQDLLPEISYIHISDLSGKDDSHWPFKTPRGVLPMSQVKRFLRKNSDKFTVNMEMRPAGTKGMVNILRSFLMLERFGSPLKFLWKGLRILLLGPYILWQLVFLHRKSE